MDKYRIDLKGMQASTSRFDFHLDDSFFAEVNASDVRKGQVDVALSVRKTSHAFDLTFHTEGVVTVTCDRCLDDLELPIHSDDKLHVRFGSAYSEEEGDWIVVPEEEGYIDVAWLMYEFIALAVPLKRVHAPGECNEAMAAQLHKYLRTTPDEVDDDEESSWESEESGDGEDKPIDPRWNELKKILDNN